MKHIQRIFMWIIFFGAISLLSACLPSSVVKTSLPASFTTVASATPTPTATAFITPTRADAAVGTETFVSTLESQVSQEDPELSQPQLERSQYHLIVNLDYQQHLVAVEERLSYLNTTEITLDTLVLLFEAQRIAQEFSLITLHWQDGSDVQNFTLQDGILTIPLPQPLLPGEIRPVVLTFVYRLPAEEGTLGYSERQANLADWYAFSAPYHPQDGWMQNSPAQVGEHLTYDLSDILVELRLTGEMTNLVIAAPAAAEEAGDAIRYIRQKARNFTLSVSPEYVLLQDSALPLYAYVFPEHVSAGQMSLRCAGEALRLYSSLYGNPDLQQLNIVEADFPDGMEYDGLFFLNWLYFEYPGSGVQSGLCTLSAHETAHQWWHRLVENDPAQQPWLDESLCTFSELVFYEQLYPDSVSWWWGYRINDYQPQGWVNSSIYDFTDYRGYVNAVYLRGAQFLDALRRTVGDEAMLNFLRAYASEYRFQRADTQGFFTLWNTQTGIDAQPTMERFFKPNQ